MLSLVYILIKILHPTKVVVVRVETFGWLALRAIDLGLFHLGRDRTDDARRDLVLQVENVLRITLEPIRPEMRAGCSVNELASNSNTVAAAADTAFEHVAYPQLASNLLDVDGS